MPGERGERPSNSEELDLLKQVVNRDRDAMTRLFQIYQPRLFRFVFRLTRSYSAAEELVNDIMFLVWEKASTFRGESRLSTWIFGIAYRQTMRRVTRHQMEQADPIELEQLLAGGDVTGETEEWIQHGLRVLPAAQRVAVVLVFYLGLSYEETAQVADCPVNTIKTRMFHAKRKLKALLEDSALPSQATGVQTNE